MPNNTSGTPTEYYKTSPDYPLLTGDFNGEFVNINGVYVAHLGPAFDVILKSAISTDSMDIFVLCPGH